MKKLNVYIALCIYPILCFAKNWTEAPNNSPDQSDSGYEGPPPPNTPTHETDELPLGYSVSYECLQCLTCQSNLQQATVIYIVNGFSAPPNTPEESILSEYHEHLVPPNIPQEPCLSEHQEHPVPPNIPQEPCLSEHQEHPVPPNTPEESCLSEHQEHPVPSGIPEFSIQSEQQQCLCGCFCFYFIKRWFHR